MERSLNVAVVAMDSLLDWYADHRRPAGDRILAGLWTVADIELRYTPAMRRDFARWLEANGVEVQRGGAPFEASILAEQRGLPSALCEAALLARDTGGVLVTSDYRAAQALQDICAVALMA